MTELRFNELRGEEVAYAAHRQERTLLPDAADCPLCPGPAGEVGEEPFEVAVFENRFPAFSPPHGSSEVVVYTDEHEGSFGGLAPERTEALMGVWRERYAELAARPDVHYVLIFENRGEETGATLHHPHGQIHAYPFLPPVPAAERGADARRGGCAVCALAAEEMAAGERVLFEEGAAVAYVPHAARWPYEVHVTFPEHRASLLDLSSTEMRDFGTGLQRVTRAYDAMWERTFPYMLVLHQQPTDGLGGGHLHAELYTPLRAPDRLKHLAGGEQGSGTFTVDVMPERAAAELREAAARAG